MIEQRKGKQNKNSTLAQNAGGIEFFPHIFLFSGIKDLP